MGQRVCWHLLLYIFKNNVGAAYRNINTELLEDSFVLWVANSGYSPGHIEFVSGNLAGNQVILVIPGYGNERISSPCAHFSQDTHLTAIAAETNAAKFI